MNGGLVLRRKCRLKFSGDVLWLALSERCIHALILTVALWQKTFRGQARRLELLNNLVVRIRRDLLRFWNRLERFFVGILASRGKVAAGVGRVRIDARLGKVHINGLANLSDRQVAGCTVRDCGRAPEVWLVFILVVHGVSPTD